MDDRDQLIRLSRASGRRIDEILDMPAEIVEDALWLVANTHDLYPWTEGKYDMPALPSNVVSYQTVTWSGAPAAGADWTVTVPAGKWWFLYAVYATLVQGLTQTPQPLLQLKDSAANLWMESTGSTTAQAISTTTAYSWAPNMLLTGQIGSGASVHSNAPIPDSLVLPGGYTIGTLTVGIGGNSQWGSMRAFVAQLGS